MKLPLQITFRDIPSSDAIRSYVERRAQKLDTFFDAIMRCHVVVEAPHRHHQHGKRYHVRVDMTVPNKELVVSRNPAENQNHEDLYAAIDDAFDDAERVLEDYAHKLKGEVKPSSRAPHAKVVRIFPYEGYGFLETTDGRDVYFHRNAVLNGGFAKLAVGTEVRFCEELGDRGPQASTVDICGKS